MKPRIEIFPEKILVGKKLKMSLGQDRTAELWQSFIPHLKEIENREGADLLSMQIYDPSFDFRQFDSSVTLVKWAGATVTHLDEIPNGMESYIIPRGTYAVFLHRGAAQIAPRTFQYIFGSWLPNSEYLIDSRPHFELLGAKYKNNDPESEEEIWIPIKRG